MKAQTFERTTFETARLLDYFTERELLFQTGHSRERWPLVVLKELVDNALDACESAGIPPELDVEVVEDGGFIRISVADNGPGHPP